MKFSVEFVLNYLIRKWLIPYKAQADPSSVLINTLSRFLNRKQEEKDGVEKITSHCFLLCFVSESVGLNVFSAKFVKFSLIIKLIECFFH